jgi:hypothetical protein
MNVARHATLARDILDHVFVNHDVVGHPCERGKAHVDLALTAGRDFMVVGLHRNADFFQERHHVGARVLELIGRRYREIPLLGAQLVPEARADLVRGVPVGLDGINFVVAVVGALAVAHFIEDKVLELRAEVGSVSDAGALEIILRLLRDVPGVPAIALSCDWITDVANQHQRSRFCERVQERRSRVGNDQHVTFVDFLEATNGGAVESNTLGNAVGIESPWRHRKVLPQTGKVGKPQINHLDLVILDRPEDILWIFAAVGHWWLPSASWTKQCLGSVGQIPSEKTGVRCSPSISTKSILILPNVWSDAR